MLRPWFLAIIILLWAVSAEAKHYSHPRIEQTIALQPDGSAVVEEIRTFDFSGQFGRAYVDRMPKGQYGQYRITYEGVWDYDSGKQLEWLQSVNEGYTRIAWRYSANNEVKRFRLRYTIDWAVQKYSDVAQFYWKCIEDDHAAIDSVILKIRLPERPPTLFAAFVHSRSGRGDRQFSSDSSSIVLRMGYVPTSSFLETRVLTDAEIIPDAAELTGEDRASLLEAERKIMEPTLMEWAAQYTAELLTLMYFAGLLIFGFGLYLIYGREPKIEEGKYLREPPSDIPPCMVPAIMTQEDIDPTQVVNGFSAALLEGVRQGYVQIEATGTSKDDTEFVLTDEGRDLLDKNIVKQKSGEREISAYEIEVLKKLFREAGSNDKISTFGIKAWAALKTGTGSEIRSFCTSWGTAMRVWFEDKFFELDDQDSSAISRSLPVGSFIVAFVLYFLLGNTDTTTIVKFAMPASVLLAGWTLAPVMAKRTMRGAREVHRWNAFKSFLTDFSSMDRASEKMLPMWDKYLVYATALGVATEFSRQLDKAMMQHPELTPTVFGTSTWGMPIHGHSVNLGSLSDFQLTDITSSLSTSLRDTAAQYASALDNFPGAGSSKSDWDFGGGGGGGGFGGGFSGGGGGGGGGGGSGAS